MDIEPVFNDWLSQRKITRTIIEEFSLRSGVHPGMGECIIIPVQSETGLFLFNKYRRSPLSNIAPKYVYDKGGINTLYGAWKAKGADHIIWVEGELDCLALWSMNIPAVTGTGGAMSVNPDWSKFFEDKEVTICFDNDRAGGEGMVKALALVPNAKILFLPDAPHIKDISDYIIHGGNVHDLVKTAKHFRSYEDVMADRAERIAMWKSTYFHDAFLKAHAERPVNKRKPSERTDEVSRAKEYPITSLLRFHQNKTRCPFHAEKEASLHYYPEQNRTWCFGGCGRGYDSIDIYRKIHNCSFKEALKALS